MTLRIYLDTSVLSALHDWRTPERQGLTRSFWARLAEYEASTSDVARQEVEGTPDLARRALLLESLGALTVFPVTRDMRDLADRYIRAGIFSPPQFSDSLHVAAAVLSRQDVLVSWNFRHLVNRRRRAAIVALNLSLGAPTLDIISPPEV